MKTRRPSPRLTSRQKVYLTPEERRAYRELQRAQLMVNARYACSPEYFGYLRDLYLPVSHRRKLAHWSRKGPGRHHQNGPTKKTVYPTWQSARKGDHDYVQRASQP